MTNLFENIDRIRNVMGLIKEEDSALQMNVNLKKTVEVLQYLKLYSQSTEKMLMDISHFAKNQIIDFIDEQKGAAAKIANALVDFKLL